ncbi:hypothetical protein QJS66_11630 [Kocuria rhizophila]|nr:hypothetical protein QJS66_11630 [Kocuria rhizophila]
MSELTVTLLQFGFLAWPCCGCCIAAVGLLPGPRPQRERRGPLAIRGRTRSAMAAEEPSGRRAEPSAAATPVTGGSRRPAPAARGARRPTRRQRLGWAPHRDARPLPEATVPLEDDYASAASPPASAGLALVPGGPWAGQRRVRAGPELVRAAAVEPVSVPRRTHRDGTEAVAPCPSPSATPLAPTWRVRSKTTTTAYAGGLAIVADGMGGQRGRRRRPPPPR